MSYYSPSEIRKRRAKAIGLGFVRPNYYDSLSDAYVASVANGVGHDGLPTGIRALLTGLLPYADLAADIHDVEFAMASRVGVEGKKDFLEANDRFRHNCRQWILQNRSRFNPQRYVELFRLGRDVEILNSDAGWGAWVATYKKSVGL